MGFFDFLDPILDFGKDLIGPLIGAGGAVAGGAISANAASQGNDASLNYQREKDKNIIQYRVEDAKKAGLHPLFALGVNPGSGAPIRVGEQDFGRGISQAGQEIGGAISRRQTPMNKQMQQAQLDNLQSQTRENDAQAIMLTSRAARDRQDANNSIGLGMQNENGIPEGRVTIGPLTTVEGQMPSKGQGIFERIAPPVNTTKVGQTGIQSGQHAAYTEFILPGGQPIQLPAGQPGEISEVLENVPLMAWPGILQYNAKFYGDPWMNDFRDFMIFGTEAKHGYPRAKNRKKGHRNQNTSPSPWHPAIP